jgi:hypothetical protein
MQEESKSPEPKKMRVEDWVVNPVFVVWDGLWDRIPADVFWRFMGKMRTTPHALQRSVILNRADGKGSPQDANGDAI